MSEKKTFRAVTAEEIIGLSDWRKRQEAFALKWTDAWGEKARAIFLNAENTNPDLVAAAARISLGKAIEKAYTKKDEKALNKLACEAYHAFNGELSCEDAVIEAFKMADYNQIRSSKKVEVELAVAGFHYLKGGQL